MDILGVLNFVFSIAVGLFLLVLLVVLHELGHAIVAKRNGVVVEEFGIGFPPMAWKKKLKNGVLFTLNWLPLGGFVKLQGEHDAAKKPGDYGAASLWAKTKILLAGVVVNWVTAVAIFTVLALVGMPKILDNQFTVPGDTQEIKKPVLLAAIGKDSPALKAGLKAGDEVVRFNDQAVPTPQALTQLAKEAKGKTVEMIYSRDGHEYTTMVTLRSEGQRGYLGVNPAQQTLLRSVWSAPIVGVATTFQFTVETLKGFGTLLGGVGHGLISQINPDEKVRSAGNKELGQATDQVAGPVGILGVIFPAAREAGFVSLMMLTGIISLTLAVMNTLPIPALDGGRLFVTLLFRALRKPLTKDIEEKIHGTGFMVLIGLVIVITVLDVGRLFK
jgi:regulator of sigma E protease